MTANQLLILIIGVFTASVGIMYHFHLRSKERADKWEKMLSWSILLLGLLIAVFPFLPVSSYIEDSDDKAESTSSLLGEEAFGGAVPQVTGDYNEARVLYEKAAILWDEAKASFDSTTSAMNYLNRSIEIYETAEALTARGQLKVQLAKMNDAMPDFNRAIQLKSDFGNAYFNRAGLYYILGDTPSACIDWKKAMELNVPNAAEVFASFCK